jgi:hypothetical protein
MMGGSTSETVMSALCKVFQHLGMSRSIAGNNNPDIEDIIDGTTSCLSDAIEELRMPPEKLFGLWVIDNYSGIPSPKCIMHQDTLTDISRFSRT